MARKRNQGGGTASKCADARCVEIVAWRQAGAGLLLDVAMGVDASRQDMQTCCVNVLCAWSKVGTNSSDPAGRDAQVGSERAFGGDDSAASDCDVEGHLIGALAFAPSILRPPKLRLP